LLIFPGLPLSSFAGYDKCDDFTHHSDAARFAGFRRSIKTKIMIRLPGPPPWLLVPAAMFVQLALGGVYAWSVFNQPLQTHFGWSKAQVVIPFEVAIGAIVIGALIGGRVQDRTGPRPVALVGGLLYATGIMLASLVQESSQLWLLTLTYGLIAGVGLGAAYITPIAMLAKWFPDHKGLVTGLAVGGFGFGAVLTAPLARWMLESTSTPTEVFFWLGFAYLLMIGVGAALFRNPPGRAGDRRDDGSSFTLGRALRTRAWWLMTAVLFLNVTCGIALVSQASDAVRSLAGASATVAATVVGMLALFNGAGRIVWAWASDRAGRMRACSAMLALQGVAYLLLPQAGSVALFFAIAAVIYLCYGGGFGVMPAAATDFFGTRHAGSIYGAMIVAWSAGGVVGPLLSSLGFEWSGQTYATVFQVTGVIALISSLVPWVVRRPAGT
jgi:OFA family oxalate/formate antiporter-like MFS transporter